tara:strand:+ start:6382 stop:7023 length:642 start_codon:yes stop_codon:yes gene_type:complete
MSRKESNARNSTLSINQQTVSQRERFSNRFDGKGVGSTNDRILFPDSPIGYSEDINGLNNRDSGLSVYEEYSKVIDNEEQTQGFGFSNIDFAHMNYNHPQNPFLDSQGNTDYKALTTGEVNSDSVPVRAYRGFPDLKVDKENIDTPSLNQDSAPSSEINLLPDGATFGNDTKSYREKISESTSTMMGRHVEGQEGNGSGDTLGKYFSKNYIEQ